MEVRRLLPVLPLWFLIFGYIMAGRMIEPYVPLYAVNDLHQDVLFVGLVYSVYAVSSFFARIPGAHLADKYGTVPFLISGVGLNAVALALFLLKQDPVFFLIGRIIQGAAFALFQPAIFSYLTRVKLPKISSHEAVAYGTTGSSVAQSVGPAIGGLLLPFGFAALFASSLSLNLITLVLCFIVLGVAFEGRRKEEGNGIAIHESPQTTEKLDEEARGFRSKGFLFLLLTRAAISYGVGAQSAFVSLFAASVLNFSVIQIGLLAALAAVFNLIGRPASSKFSERYGERNAIILSAILMALGLLILALLRYDWMVWLSMPFYGMGLGMFIPSSVLQVVKMVPERRRTLGIGLLTLMLDVGMAVGSAASAIILLTGGYPWVFGVAFLICLGGAVVQLDLRLIRSVGSKATASIDAKS